ncbi:IS200/IS605 family transposase, partial [Streptosporangium sp. OZ121]|uniref:IS200/IS605 family transposase n=1 Tax=Streptosporangium sp. OZ121 TaxID=3444183 RepID=UPI003F7A6F41
MTRQVRTCPGAAYDLGYHVVWCPKYRRPVLDGRVKTRLEELIHAKADEHGRQIVALEVMPDHEHIRAEDPDGQGRWSFSSQQATLRRLDTAFAAFFARLQAGRTPGYPRFKGRGRFDTVTWPKDGDGCRWDSQPEHPSVTFVRLQGVGHVRVHR